MGREVPGAEGDLELGLNQAMGAKLPLRNRIETIKIRNQECGEGVEGHTL